MIALAPPLLLITAGVGLLRHAWGGRQRLAVALAWVAITTGLLWLASRDGAWGLSVGGIAAMLVAGGLLAQAAIAAPERAKPIRAERSPSVALHVESWGGVARRVGIFLLAVPGAGIAALLAALALQAAARAGGWAEADSVTLTLLVTPILWTVLTVVVMLEERIGAMARIVAVFGGVGGAAFWAMA